MILALLIYLLGPNPPPDNWHKWCERHLVADDPYDNRSENETDQ